MARSLYETQPNFRRTLDLCDEILRPLVERSLISVLYDSAVDVKAIDQTAYTQPALFAVEYALARLWESWGVRPDALLGHSVGEYPAACLAGVFSLEDGLRLIAERARRMQELPGSGQMAAILTSEAEVAAELARYGARLSIAAVNGPENVVVSGETDAVRQIVNHFQAAGTACQALTVSHAFHSAQLDPMLDGFEDFARGLAFQAPQVTLISNRTGRAFAPDEIPSAAYWRQHSRQCVQFDRGMATLVEAGCEIFLEVGPAPVLLGMGRRVRLKTSASGCPRCAAARMTGACCCPRWECCTCGECRLIGKHSIGRMHRCVCRCRRIPSSGSGIGWNPTMSAAVEPAPVRWPGAEWPASIRCLERGYRRRWP